MELTTDALPKERILQAALALLEAGGVEAVSTRSVSAAAKVQVPTIYRQFGDMQGLLDAVAQAGFELHLRAKRAEAHLDDPVEELHRGWDMHVDFGLSHQHLYALMYGSMTRTGPSLAEQQATEIFRALLKRVAQSGQLAVSVDRAASMISAAVVGTVLSLLSDRTREAAVSDLMRQAVFQSILVTGPAKTPDLKKPGVTAHAVALAELLPDLPAAFSPGERVLMMEWLHRLT